MKKIGIITFHRAHNFGAMLQAFALQSKVSEQYQAEIIDYRSEFEENKYFGKVSLKAKIKNGLRWILKPQMMFRMNRKRRNFSRFRDTYLVTSDRIFTDCDITDANDSYDLVISGSDQVWNPEITHGNLNYFLSFADEQKRYSYAASFGGRQVLTSPVKEEISALLNTFQSMLLRENSGFELLSQLNVKTKTAPCIVCDPVFLLSKDEWISKLELKECTDRYILLFLVTEARYAIEFAKKLSEKTGLPVKYINSYASYKNVPEWCEDYMDVGPREFLELLMNAEYVVATSFHGMALSVVFNKQLFFELNHNADNTNDRLITLAEIFGLEDREIRDDCVFREKKIDYSVVNTKLQWYRERSERALFNSLYE